MGHGWPSPNFTAAQADAVDRKIDDGVPETGRVRAVLYYGDAAGQEFGSDAAGNSGCIRTAGAYDVLGFGVAGGPDTGNP